MITKQFAEGFATHWIEAWNTRDLELVLSHYADDFVLKSPLIALVTGEPSGILKGKSAISKYWKRALDLAPSLHFELVSFLFGVDSIAIYYKGTRGMALEVFFFDVHGIVKESCAHYA